jgi:hypothetical protein
MSNQYQKQKEKWKEQGKQEFIIRFTANLLLFEDVEPCCHGLQKSDIFNIIEELRK